MSTSGFVIPILFAAALIACAPSGQWSAAPKLTNTGSPALHAIDSSELRQVMERMNNLMYETNLTDQELDNQRREAVFRVSTAATGLEQAIDGILAAESKLNLDEGEQKVFRSLAVKLGTDAHKLKAQAQVNQIDAIPVTLEKINATCTSCHELFRDFSKPGAHK